MPSCTPCPLPIFPPCGRHPFNIAVFSSALAVVGCVGVGWTSDTVIANVFLFISSSLFLMHVESFLVEILFSKWILFDDEIIFVQIYLLDNFFCLLYLIIIIS